jgi:hypothetical protein
MVLFSSSRQIPGRYFKLGHDRFLSHLFQFVIHYHPIFLLCIDSVTFSDILLERSIMLVMSLRVQGRQPVSTVLHICVAFMVLPTGITSGNGNRNITVGSIYPDANQYISPYNWIHRRLVFRKRQSHRYQTAARMTAFSLPTEILISSNSKTNFCNRVLAEIARLLCFSLFRWHMDYRFKGYFKLR